MTIVINPTSIQEKIDNASEGLKVDAVSWFQKVEKQTHGAASNKKVNDTLIQTALENIDEANPDWTYAAARIYVGNLYKEAAANRGYEESEKYGSFYHLIKMLTDEGIYTPAFLEKYSKEEIDQIGSFVSPEKDMLFELDLVLIQTIVKSILEFFQ